METLKDMPADGLREVLDYLIWEGPHAGAAMVRDWRAELLARSDAGDEEVLRAVAVCDEYLAPEGSEEGRVAALRAWPELESLLSAPS